jgi:hypothetical protein
MANTWNQSGTTWGQNAYGEQADVDLTLTGLSTTSSTGSISIDIIPNVGWGSDTWGFEN